jgi:CelD/BcsL family acetyltransferase involved in cellulose biosynthesis
MHTIQSNFDGSLSPYHPSNIVRLRNLRAHMAPCDGNDTKRYTIVDNIFDLEDDWRRIEQDIHVSIHQSYAWSRAWIHHKKIIPIFIVGRLDGRVEFILPLEVSTHFGIRTAKLIATDHSNFNFVLCSNSFLASCGSDFTDHIMSDLKALKLPVDVILLDRMQIQFKSANNPFSKVIRTRNQNASFQLPLEPNFNETLAQINGKRKRKKFRGADRTLTAAGGYTYHIAKSTAEREKILSAFFEQKAKRLKGQGLPNFFADDQLKAFFGELVDISDHEIGGIELHTITMNGDKYGGHILAISATTAKRDHAICQFSSFNEDLAAELECSPGEFLFFLTIKDMNERGYRVFDFGIGDQTYKRSWCTERTEHFDGAMPLNGFGKIYALAARQKTRLKRYIKSSVTLHKIAAKIRSFTA